MLCDAMWVFICFGTDLPLWPSGAETWTNRAEFTSVHSNHKRLASLTTSVRPSKHKHSWFRRWYRHIKRWMNYILHLPFRHEAGNLIRSDICFEFLLVITGRRKAIESLYFWLHKWKTLKALNGGRKRQLHIWIYLWNNHAGWAVHWTRLCSDLHFLFLVVGF